MAWDSRTLSKRTGSEARDFIEVTITGDEHEVDT